MSFDASSSNTIVQNPVAVVLPGLTLIGHMKDSLWNLDLFRCESMRLKIHWLLVVMTQFTGLLAGFGIHAGDVGGVVLCRMFNRVIPG